MTTRTLRFAAGLSLACLAGCAHQPLSASDCGRHFTGGSGLLGLAGAMGAFDRDAGPDCKLEGRVAVVPDLYIPPAPPTVQTTPEPAPAPLPETPPSLFVPGGGGHARWDRRLWPDARHGPRWRRHIPPDALGRRPDHEPPLSRLRIPARHGRHSRHRFAGGRGRDRDRPSDRVVLSLSRPPSGGSDRRSRGQTFRLGQEPAGG